jgi:acetyl-CoA carboxylase beta subunit
VIDSDRSREDDWFRQNEQELLEAARKAREKREQERAARESAEERQRLRKLHWMKCPKCGHDLREEDLDGVKVDRCSACEGLYLDASELEQLFLARNGEQRRGIVRRMLGI